MSGANAALAAALNATFAATFPEGSVLELRTGERPGANAGAAGDIVVELLLPGQPWVPGPAGLLEQRVLWRGTVQRTGKVEHYRLRNAEGTKWEEGTVGLRPAAGSRKVPDLVLDQLTLLEGQVVEIKQYTKRYGD